MPRPGVVSPAFINGWRSRIYANASSGMTPFLENVILISTILYWPARDPQGKLTFFRIFSEQTKILASH